jgi:hypothetical protein
MIMLDAQYWLLDHGCAVEKTAEDRKQRAKSIA